MKEQIIGKRRWKWLCTFFSLLIVFCVLNDKSLSDVNASVPTSVQRDTIVAYMRSMATIPWTTGDTALTIAGKSYAANTTFTGIPYSQTNGTIYAAFVTALTYEDKDPLGKLTTSDIGNDCADAVQFSWAQVVSGIPHTNALGLVEKARIDSKMTIIGKSTGIITINKTMLEPHDMLTFEQSTGVLYNTKLELKKAYSYLQAGCTLVHDHHYGTTGSNHAILVSIVGSNGIYCIDQDGSVDADADVPDCSTWNVNRYLSFDTLYSMGYIPIGLSF